VATLPAPLRNGSHSSQKKGSRHSRPGSEEVKNGSIFRFAAKIHVVGVKNRVEEAALGSVPIEYAECSPHASRTWTRKSGPDQFPEFCRVHKKGVRGANRRRRGICKCHRTGAIWRIGSLFCVPGKIVHIGRSGGFLVEDAEARVAAAEVAYRKSRDRLTDDVVFDVVKTDTHG
jgi:hypothetical protein